MNDPEKYSLIVIGGGITGLSTAITWALNNPAGERPVLVIEKEPVVGGYVTTFARQGFSFDTVQIIPDSFDVLNYFGVKIDLIKFEGYYARIFLTDAATHTVKCINIPSGFKEFKSFLLDRYPAQKDQLTRFFEYSSAMFEELFHLKVEPTFFEIMSILFHCPKIIAQSNKTFRQLIEKFKFTEPEIIEVLDVFAAFSGLPANRVSALLPVSAMMTSLNGSYRPCKGFIEFPMKMKQRLVDLGGQVLTKSRVKKILIENNRAYGILLDDGRMFHADHVVTTIDSKAAMHDLVGDAVLQKASVPYAKKVREMKMSGSAFMINIGLDDGIDLKALGFDCGYNLLTTGKEIYDRLFESFDKGELFMNREKFYVPVICPSLPTGRKNALTLFVYPADINGWKELRESNHAAYMLAKEKIAGFFLDLVEEYMIPGLKSHILYKDVASPATFARYSGSPTGSKFDMAPYPDNFGKNRLKMRTPIKNLYQPKFSHGIWPCLQAGIQVVDMIMDGRIMNGNSRYEASAPRQGLPWVADSSRRGSTSTTRNS